MSGLREAALAELANAGRAAERAASA